MRFDFKGPVRLVGAEVLKGFRVEGLGYCSSSPLICRNTFNYFLLTTSKKTLNPVYPCKPRFSVELSIEL